MRQCNNCAKTGCRIMKSEWPTFRTKHRISPEGMREDCPNHVEPNKFRVTIFERLMQKQSAKLIELLTRMELRFVDTNRAPFFTFSPT